MTTPPPEAPEQEASSVPVTQLTVAEARTFLMKNESYCTLEMPEYFDFARVLARVSEAMSDRRLADMSLKDVIKYERVNHTILSNKSGRLDWRPIQLIHPAFYVEIVNVITEEENWKLIKAKFDESEVDQLVECSSIPRDTNGNRRDVAEIVRSWWTDYEQRSIELALEFGFMATADLVDCYSSVYTHSIAWALHGKEKSKPKPKGKPDKRLLGNKIDKLMRDMHQAQTNGIPQGSVLSNAIAEIVLRYLDSLLVCNLKSRELSNPEDIRILRYRDDYRIFVKDDRSARAALQALTEAARELGFKLNSGKTSVSSDIITASISEEKMEWGLSSSRRLNLLNGLLAIRRHGLMFPDAGSLRQELTRYFNRIQRSDGSRYRVTTLASVVTDIGLRNPTTYPHVAAILSVLIDLAEEGDRDGIIRAAVNKFKAEPYSGHIELWLQRVVRKVTNEHTFEEPLCRRFDKKDVPIWENDWITSKALKDAVSNTDFIDRDRFEEMGTQVARSEVDLFSIHYEDR